MSVYATTEKVQQLGVLTAAAVDEWVRKHTKESLAAIIESESGYVDSRLAKRYATPFQDPISDVVVRWTCDLVVERMFDKRGSNPQDNDLRENIKLRADKVREELREAADAQNGLFDLPLRDNTNASGIAGASPLGFAQASPYDWTDEQRRSVYGS